MDTDANVVRFLGQMHGKHDTTLILAKSRHQQDYLRTRDRLQQLQRVQLNISYSLDDIMTLPHIYDEFMKRSRTVTRTYAPYQSNHELIAYPNESNH